MSRKIGWVCWDDLRAVSLQNGIVLYLQISKCMMQLTVQNLSSCPHRRSRFWEKTTRVFFEPAKHVHHGGNSGSLQQFFIGFFKQQWGSVWKSKFSETSTNLVKWRSIQPYTATGDSKLLQIEIVKCLLFFSKVICCYDENILCVFLCSVVWTFTFPKMKAYKSCKVFPITPLSKNVRLTTRGRTPHRHGFFLQLLKKGSNNEEKITRLLNWGCFVTFQSHRIKDGHERKALETLNRWKSMTMATMMMAIMMVIVTLMMTMAYADTTRATIYL